MTPLAICGTQLRVQEQLNGKNGHSRVLGLEICALKPAGPNQWTLLSAGNEHCECVVRSCKSAVSRATAYLSQDY